MKQKYFFLILCIFFLTAAGIQYWIFTSGYYSISSDESARTLDAYKWFKTKTVIAEVWLPMHAIIHGYSLEVNNDLVITPRAVSLIFSLAGIAGLIFLSYQLFKNKFITLTAALIYTFLPERIILSAVPLAEIIFICFIIWGSAFLMMRMNSNKSSALLAAALFWALSGTLRYEGWIFSFSILLYSIYEYRRGFISIKYLLVIAALLISFPLCWILLSYLMYGNPLEFLTGTSQMFAAKFGSAFINGIYLNVIWQFIEQNYNSYNCIGIAALFFLLLNRKLSPWIIVCFSGLLLMGLISAFGKALPSHNFWRTSAVWTTLLVPFTAYLLHELPEYIILKKINIKISFIIIILMLSQFGDLTITRLEKMNSSYCLNEKNMAIGNSLIRIIMNSQAVSEVKNMDKLNDLILIEKNRSFEHLNIPVSSNHPDHFIFFENQEAPLPPSRPEIRGRFPSIKGVKKINIGYLFFKSDEMKNYLDSQEGLVKIRKFGDWILYKII